jgi:EAL and modified HD-GYP domain-containing signal transduction protein
MFGHQYGFLGRQPIADRSGDVLGYELLFRAHAEDQQAQFLDEDSASLLVVSTLLNDLGDLQVLGGKLAFVNIGPQSLNESAGMLALVNPRRTVLELSRSILPTPDHLERLRALREQGFGLALMAEPPFGTIRPWLHVVTHLKIDVQRVPEYELARFVMEVSAPGRFLIAEKVETAEHARWCLDLGFDGLQGWYVGRPEVMGRVKPGVAHSVISRALAQLSAGCDLVEVERTLRDDVALCWRLLRYAVACNQGLMISVDSMRDAMQVIGSKRLIRWLQLVLGTVEEPSAAVRSLARSACMRGHLMLELGADCFSGSDLDNLFLVGALSYLPAMLMEPMASVVSSMALSEAVSEALIRHQGPLGALLDLAEALEDDTADRIQAVCDQLSISPRVARRAWVMTQAAKAEDVAI